MTSDPLAALRRLDATVTARELDVQLTDLDTMLRRLRAQLESRWSPA
jgi:hypothetical protein